MRICSDLCTKKILQSYWVVCDGVCLLHLVWKTKYTLQNNSFQLCWKTRGPWPICLLRPLRTPCCHQKLVSHDGSGFWFFEHLLMVSYQTNTYPLPYLTQIFSVHSTPIWKVFKDDIKLGMENPGIDALMTEQTKTLAMRFIYDEDHINNDFLDKCPSGRYCTVKYSGAWGRDCFLRHLLHTLNNILCLSQLAS